MIGRAANALKAARAIQDEVRSIVGPPSEGFRSESDLVVPALLFKNTRGYLEKTSNQINGAYSKGWYDACAVMLRRLIETLIIEAFEKQGLSTKVKNSRGDFFFLGDLVSAALVETSWNLSRNTKQGLPRLKDVGDKSAHSRRYNAVRGDIDPLRTDVRVVVEEFLYLSGLRK